MRLTLCDPDVAIRKDYSLRSRQETVYERVHDDEYGTYETVEGQVENFVPMPKEGKGSESFDLGGVYFEYSDNRLITGYHNAKVNGGVIRRNGQRLRIGYVWYEPYGNVIVSIEEIDES